MPRLPLGPLLAPVFTALAACGGAPPPKDNPPVDITGGFTDVGEGTTAGGSGAGTGTGGGTGTGTGTEGCAWGDYDICFEVIDLDAAGEWEDTAAWCADLGDFYGLETTHLAEGCPSDPLLDCDLTGFADLFPGPPSQVIGHFYIPTYSETDAEMVCVESGGVVL